MKLMRKMNLCKRYRLQVGHLLMFLGIFSEVLKTLLQVDRDTRPTEDQLLLHLRLVHYLIIGLQS